MNIDIAVIFLYIAAIFLNILHIWKRNDIFIYLFLDAHAVKMSISSSDFVRVQGGDTEKSHSPHTLPTLSPHSRHTLPTLSPHSRHTLPTLSPHSPHTLPTLSPQYPHTLPTLSPSVKRKVWNKKCETKSVKQKVWNKKWETKSVKQKVWNKDFQILFNFYQHTLLNMNKMHD